MIVLSQHAHLNPPKTYPPPTENGHSLSPGRGLLHYMPAVLDYHHAAEDLYSTIKGFYLFLGEKPSHEASPSALARFA